MMRPRRRGGHNLGLMLLFFEMARFGFDRIPPVTLVSIVGQVAIFLRLGKFHYPSIGQVCISGVNVWYKEEIKRLFLAPFFHLDDWHLYFNMASLLSKGPSLERKFGSGYFMYMIALFSVLTSAATVALGVGLEQMTGDYWYIQQCAAGFSGVLFALKIITTYEMPPGITRIMGFFPVHSRLACWVELVLISIMVPNASFVGHLAGILVGFAYVKGPLKKIMDILIPPEPRYAYQTRSTGYRQPNNNNGRTTGYSQQSAPNTRGTRQGNWPWQQTASTGEGASASAPPANEYNDYTGGMSEEEQVARALANSMNDGQNSGYASPPPSAPAFPEPPPYPGDDSPTIPNTGNTSPNTGNTNRLYPDLSQQNRDLFPQSQAPSFGNTGQLSNEEIRRRRLARYDR